MIRSHSLYPTVARRWCDDVGYTGSTREDKLTTLRCFQRRLDTRHGKGAVRFSEIDTADVRQFIEYDDDGERRADRTRKTYLSTIHRIFEWATDPDIKLADRNPAARIRQVSAHRPVQAKRAGVWLGEERAKTLVATTAGRDTVPGFRNAFLVRLALYTGLRANELITLRWRDVDLAGGYIMVTGKFGKIAPVDILPSLRKTLVAWRTAYIEGLGHDRLDDLPVVCAISSRLAGGAERSNKRVEQILWGEPITYTGTVRKAVVAAGETIGVKLSTHDLRRSWAGILKDRGKSDEEIRKALRHDDTKTTRIYLESKPERLTDVDDLDFG